MLFAPIQSLPPETLSLIFGFVVECNYFTRCCLHVGGRKRQSTFFLMQVCHSWWHVACNTPEIWSSVCISAPIKWSTGEKSCTLSLKQRFTESIALAKSIPLLVDITVRCTLLDHKAALKFFKSVFRQLVNHAPQWHSLSLSVSSYASDEVCPLSYSPYQKPDPVHQTAFPGSFSHSNISKTLALYNWKKRLSVLKSTRTNPVDTEHGDSMIRVIEFGIIFFITYFIV